MNATLCNRDHPEYGAATIPLPIPDEEYAHCMELLEALEIGSVSGHDCYVDQISDAPPSLDMLEGTMINVDRLGRCGPAMACLGRELIPAEERGEIGMIRPSGWHTVRYDDLIEDKYLYNRCHLIAYMLAGENDNELNLITGTRYMNTEGMLPFEIEVADYIFKTGNHVLYRVTPCFSDNDLVAMGGPYGSIFRRR